MVQQQDKTQQAQTEIQEIGLKYKKNLLYSEGGQTVEQVAQQGCEDTPNPTGEDTEQPALADPSLTCRGDLVDFQMSLLRSLHRISIFLWFCGICGCHPPAYFPESLNFMTSSFLPPSKFTLTYHIVSGFFLLLAFLFYAQDLARLAALSYSTCSPFQNYPSWAAIVISGANFICWPEISYHFVDKKKKQKDWKGVAQLKFSHREEFSYVPVKGK